MSPQNSLPAAHPPPSGPRHRRHGHGEDQHKRWLPIYPPQSRKIRLLHNILLATMLTLPIIAILREQLLWIAATLFGIGSGLPTGSKTPSALILHTDNTFRISIFEDLHFGEDEDTDWAPAQDRQSIVVMNTVLDAEHPDLVVLNGDLITGENTYAHNATLYVDQIVTPLVQRNLKWASAYGNHDMQAQLAGSDVLARERVVGGPLSLTRQMVAGDESVIGVTNYYLLVSDAKGRPQVVLWFFDSKGGQRFGDGKGMPGVVDPAVVDWFKSTEAQLAAQYKRDVPSLVFVHIPVAPMLKQQSKGIDPYKEPGINEDNPLGAQQEGVNGPFAQALMGSTGVRALYSGHDHGNDWCSSLARPSQPPLFTCFGRHSGYGGYSRWMRGSRQVKLKVSPKSEFGIDIESWIRLEDGSESGRVRLNSTFGTDRYAAVKKVETHLK